MSNLLSPKRLASIKAYAIAGARDAYVQVLLDHIEAQTEREGGVERKLAEARKLWDGPISAVYSHYSMASASLEVMKEMDAVLAELPKTE